MKASEFRAIERRLKTIEKAVGVRKKYDETAEKMSEARSRCLSDDPDSYDSQFLTEEVQWKYLCFSQRLPSGECKKVKMTYLEFVKKHGNFTYPWGTRDFKLQEKEAHSLGFLDIYSLERGYWAARQHAFLSGAYGEGGDCVSDLEYGYFFAESNRFLKEEFGLSGDEWARYLRKDLLPQDYRLPFERTMVLCAFDEALKELATRNESRPVTEMEKHYGMYHFSRNYLSIRDSIDESMRADNIAGKAQAALDAIALVTRCPWSVFVYQPPGICDDRIPFFTTSSFPNGQYESFQDVGFSVFPPIFYRKVEKISQKIKENGPITGERLLG